MKEFVKKDNGVRTMARSKKGLIGHTGSTDDQYTLPRDMKVESHRQGDHWLAAATFPTSTTEQGGISHWRRVDGNLAVGRITAHKVLGALDEGRPFPIDYASTSPVKLVEGFLDSVAHVQKLALRLLQDRYRVAPIRFTISAARRRRLARSTRTMYAQLLSRLSTGAFKAYMPFLSC